MQLTFTRSNGDVVCNRCDVADDPVKRAKGLLGRAALERGEGMYFASSAILTSFTRFSVDAVFVDEDFTVVDIRPAVKPWRLAFSRGARGVLELPAGSCERLGLRLGERLAPSAACKGGNGNGAEPRAAETEQLRVLVATSDQRFAKVAAFLLARQGFSAETHQTLDRVVGAVRDGKTDVVLLDATAGVAAAARVTRALGALDSPSAAARVVMVAGDETGATTTPPSRTMHVLPKWGPFDDLVAAVRASHRDAQLLELH
jgi:uncharacterized protein